MNGIIEKIPTEFREWCEFIVAIAVCNWMALTAGTFLLLYNVVLN